MVKPIIVAEISINHLGMVNVLKKMILSARRSGADYIKLKVKDVKKYYPDDGKRWRNMDFKQYRQSLELDMDEFVEIANFCADQKIPWFCTVHDDFGIQLIQQFDVPFYKIASSDSGDNVITLSIIDIAANHKKPVIISVGGKAMSDVETIVRHCEDAGVAAYILHTTSIYPTPIGNSNINRILKLRKEFESDKIKIGYSGHEIGYAPTLLAVMYGAQMIERHFCLSRDLKIHHIKAGLIPDEFKDMTGLIDQICIERGAEPVDFQADELRFLKDKQYE